MKDIIALVAVCGFAAGAGADIVAAPVDRSGYEIYTATNTQIGVVSPAGVAPDVQYSNISSAAEGFFSLQNAAPFTDLGLDIVNFDDYQSVAGGDITMTQFSFVGGVNAGVAGAAGQGVVFFDFFDAGGALVDGFGAILSEGGNFIWTLTLGTPFDIANGGFVQMSFDDENLFGFGASTDASWFLTADDATVGDNLLSAGFTSPAGADLNQAFEIVGVPTPGAFTLLGLGGLVAARRRR